LDGGIQLELAGFDELHHRQGGKRLGRGANGEGRLRGGGVTPWASHPKAAQVHNPVAFDDGERCAGDVQPMPLRFDVGIDGIIARAV
jgi:hypothetical protein